MTDIKFILLFYGGWRSVEGLFALPLPVRISELNVRTSAGTSRHYNNTAVNQWSLGQVSGFFPSSKLSYSHIKSNCLIVGGFFVVQAQSP